MQRGISWVRSSRGMGGICSCRDGRLIRFGYYILNGWVVTGRPGRLALLETSLSGVENGEVGRPYLMRLSTWRVLAATQLISATMPQGSSQDILQ